MVNVLFRLLTIYLLVPWLLLLLLPKSVLTRKLLLDRRYWLGVGGLYFLALFFFAWDVNWLQFLLPTTEGIREAFQHENLPLFVWIHMVAVNLFMGRWIAEDGFKKGFFLFPFLLVTLLLGPVGLAFYLVYKERKKYKRKKRRTSRGEA